MIFMLNEFDNWTFNVLGKGVNVWIISELFGNEVVSIVVSEDIGGRDV